jgi:hypothetical protein
MTHAPQHRRQVDDLGSTVTAETTLELLDLGQQRGDAQIMLASQLGDLKAPPTVPLGFRLRKQVRPGRADHVGGGASRL